MNLRISKRRPSREKAHAHAGSSRELAANPPSSERAPAPPEREPGKGGEQPARQRRGEPAALYLRVSTREQTTDNQRPDLEQLARARGYELVATYEEHASAAKARPEFARMLEDAHRGAFRIILVWAIDRFGRSMLGNLQDVLELDRRGVQVVSFREPWLDTGSPARGLLIAVFSWVAEQERAQLIARTKAGLEYARRKGKRLGRPPARFDVERARRLVAGGASVRAVAKKLRVSVTTLARTLKGAAHVEAQAPVPAGARTPTDAPRRSGRRRGRR